MPLCQQTERLLSLFVIHSNRLNQFLDFGFFSALIPSEIRQRLSYKFITNHVIAGFSDTLLSGSE